MASQTFEDIAKALRAGKPEKVYLLHGTEGYYIDQLLPRFEALIAEDERDFNLTVLYATETEPAVVADACTRYPMMAERQVVILKEVQSVRANYLEALTHYVENPTPTTVFVIASRGELIKSKTFTKAAEKAGAVVMETKKLYESQVAPKINGMISAAGMGIEPKALEMMRDFVGTDLSRIAREVEKLTVALPRGATVTPSAVEKLIGVSKEFNNFELTSAIARRDVAAANKCVEYFARDPKHNPSVVTCATIFNFFAKLLVCRYTPNYTSEDVLMKVTGVRFPKGLADYRNGLANFNARQIINAISACRRFDTRAKGIGSRADEYDLLRELLFQIFN
jgi:DNA polymerase-3 subunit delta